MSEHTSIEWTATRNPDGTVTPGATWNPIRGQNARHTCARISPGCTNCYAATMTRRGLGGTAPIDYGVGETPNDPARLDEHALTQPLRWKKPRTIFVCSMTDLFGTWVPDEWLDRIYGVMALAPQHTFQVLTKRPTRMAAYLNDRSGEFGYGPRSRIWWAARPFSEGMMHRDAYAALPVGKPGYGPEGVYLRDWPLPHVWVGVSIESDAYVWRANVLREIPAAVRWISAEPLLSGLPSLDLTGIDWLVAGGESGPGARPMHPQWARDLRDRCVASGTSYFFKQWGAWLPGQNDPTPAQASGIAHWQDGGWDLRQPKNPQNYVTWNADGALRPGFHPPTPVAAFAIRVGKHKSGRLLDGREWSEMPASRTPALVAASSPSSRGVEAGE